MATPQDALGISPPSPSSKLSDKAMSIPDANFQSSPKSSPRGSRSPGYSKPDSTGTLKATISLGKNPAVITSGPFYLTKDPPEQVELTGSTNLMQYYGLEHSYMKFSGKKLKEELSSFLPNLPGYIDTPGMQDNSSLRSLIEKPPITGKELHPLNGAQLTGFRLHPGPLPEQYRLLSQSAPPKAKKLKKHKKDVEKSIQSSQAIDSTPKKDESRKNKDDPKRKDRKKKKKKKEKEKDEKASAN